MKTLRLGYVLFASILSEFVTTGTILRFKMHQENQASKDSEAADSQSVHMSDVVRRLDSLWSYSLTGPEIVPNLSSTGTSVGRYVIERVIGQGAFGIVYKAHDPELNRTVALKIPRPEVLLDNDRLARFEGEVQACARLDHPGIVPLFEADLSRSVPYMASAYCPGPNLQQWMDSRSQPCEIEAAVVLVEKIARAVQYAHDNGVVHRDLKPGNILLAPNDVAPSTAALLNDYQPRLTDFGLAQITHGLHESRSSLIIGTPLYMSPEQAESRSDSVGPCSDIFGLGAILYHLLSGVAPFAAPNYAAVLLRLRDESAIPVSQLRPEVDVDLETVCMKCLHRDPSDRYASAGELADDLKRVIHRQAIKGRRMTWGQRLRRWSHEGVRINESTQAIVLLAVMRLLFGPGGLMMVILTPGVSITGPELIEAMAAHFLLTGPVDAWLIWVAYQNQKQRISSKSYWLLMLLFLALSSLTLLVSAGIVPPMQWYKRSSGARVLTFSFISLTYYFQAIAWYFADWERIKRRKTNLVRRRFKQWLLVVPIAVAVSIPGFRFLTAKSDPPSLVGPRESMLLDGIDDYLTVENVGFDSDLPITLEAWIQPDKPHRGVIVSHGPIALTVVAAGDGNRFRVHLSLSNDQLFLVDARESFRTNSWTHVAMIYDAGRLQLFINGKRQDYEVSRYDTESDLVVPNATLPNPLVIVDLWPGSRTILGNIRSTDRGVKFCFSGRLGEIRLSRSAFYFEEFQPEFQFATSPETVFLFHLKDGREWISDATNRYTAELHR